MTDEYSYNADGFIDDSDQLPSTSGAAITCQAFMLKMKQVFGFKHFPLVFDEDVKGAVNRANGNTIGSPKSLYPFGYFRVTSIGVNEDAHNTKLIAKVGSGIAITPDLESATIVKLYKFWANIELDITVEFNDAIQAFKFAEKMSVIIKSKALNTGVELENGDAWVIIFEGSPAISIPQASKDAENAPNVMQINFQLIAKTQIGEARDVPKINNEGIITRNTSVQNSEVDSE